MAPQTNLIAAAGEHYVLCELLRRGHIAGLAPTGAPKADIVVTDAECARLCSIQVKTSRGGRRDKGWHMNAKHEDIREPRLFYCFVDFQNSNELRPLLYVMPSDVVAGAVHKAHQEWLSKRGKNDHVRKDSSFRRLLTDYSRTFEAHENPYPAGWMDQVH